MCGVSLDVKPANFATNGNAVESQEAIYESGENKVSVRFYNRWNPMQIINPKSAIKQEIDIVSYKNGNPTAIRTLVEKKSMSLKNAERNYNEMLDQWKRLTKQPQIFFESAEEQKHNRSVLNKLHKNQGKVSQATSPSDKQHIKEKGATR